MLFCAGADIKAFTQMTDPSAGRALLDGMHTLLRRMEQSPIVTIAAVNALAFGGGCELAMGCDIRIAADSATFGQPEINLGIIPGFGGTQRLPRLVGVNKALEMNLTGEPIGADEAFEFGLVNRVVPDHELLDTALAWARKLAGQAPLAIEQIKTVSGAGDLDAGIEAEKDAFVKVFASEDAREGIGAFLGKRQPQFKGR
jgi:enoyl-CoA hydratase/3-hydroxyacyl-CoA dehydrogenase